MIKKNKSFVFSKIKVLHRNDYFVFLQEFDIEKKLKSIVDYKKIYVFVR